MLVVVPSPYMCQKPTSNDSTIYFMFESILGSFCGGVCGGVILIDVGGGTGQRSQSRGVGGDGSCIPFTFGL